jgi:hypothetical protein
VASWVGVIWLSREHLTPTDARLLVKAGITHVHELAHGDPVHDPAKGGAGSRCGESAPSGT